MDSTSFSAATYKSLDLEHVKEETKTPWQTLGQHLKKYDRLQNTELQWK